MLLVGSRPSSSQIVDGTALVVWPCCSDVARPAQGKRERERDRDRDRDRDGDGETNGYGEDSADRVEDCKASQPCMQRKKHEYVHAQAELRGKKEEVEKLKCHLHKKANSKCKFCQRHKEAVQTQ